jgi:hypothetical protein
MTEPLAADTQRMRAASKELEAVYNRMDATTRALVQNIRELGQAMHEQGIQRQLDRLAENLTQADNSIHRELLNIGVELHERATGIDSVVANTQVDLASAADEIAGDGQRGGRYGKELNG